MIEVARRPLTDREAKLITEWINHEGTGEFLRTIRDAVVELQVKAGDAACDPVKLRDDEISEAQLQAVFYKGVLKLFEDVKSGNLELFRVNLVIKQNPNE